MTSDESIGWNFEYDVYSPEQEGLREALCTLGNGYFAARGAFADASADGTHYPGTYVAGLYNRLETPIQGRGVENEDLVNLPNWLPLTFRIGEDPWFAIDRVEVLDFHQRLDLAAGVLMRHIRFRDKQGRVTRWRERRIVSMARCHAAGLEVELAAENWQGEITVRSALDAGITNAGVARYRKLAGRHLETLETREEGAECVSVRCRTVQSRVEVVEAARLRLFSGPDRLTMPLSVTRETNAVAQEVRLEMTGAPVRLEKIVTLYTSRAPAIAEAGAAAVTELHRTESFEAMLAAHRRAWRHLWDRCDIAFERAGGNGEATKLRLHIFHLLQTVSPHTADHDVGIPARGWHGEAYRGHVFWDELFILPFLTLRLPVLVRGAMRYRYRRIDEARHAAAAEGFSGAMFPWQSGSDGREETQKLHLNPKSGRWLPDHSHRQRHVNVAICYNIWRYWEATHDTGFMYDFGAEMFLSIVQFWASVASYEPATDRYEINGVMGPDEFHTHYPDADPDREGGLRNNAYTNILVAWILTRARDVVDILPPERLGKILEITGLRREDVDRWYEIARKLKVPFQADGIISQFEGYEALKELDWDHYRRRYGDIHRLDRILEAEGDDVNRYKVSKQADVLMVFYLLSAEEIRQVFEQLGYPFEHDTIPRNILYYMERTSHGSTLSLITHAWVLARSDREHSWELFQRALDSDIADIQGGTTPEGIHTGAMAGTVDLVQRNYLGLETRAGVLHFNPMLPDCVERLRVGLEYRQHRLRVEATHTTLDIRSHREIAPMIDIAYRSHARKLMPGDRQTFTLMQPREPTPAEERRNATGAKGGSPKRMEDAVRGDRRETGHTGGGLDLSDCKAVIFDMDGVITDTAALHAAAWKALFDDLLKTRAEESGEEGGEEFVPFTVDDYRSFVDGKPRLDGVRSFLASRKIELPEGKAGDPPGATTVHGLGDRKNGFFRKCLEERGITAFPDTISLVGRLREAGIRVGAISSSRNAEDILEKAGVRDLFEVLIEGNRSADRGIAGKPAPDIFLEAVRELGVEPADAAIVEDATAGVEAGRRGGFKVVVGLARRGGGERLAAAGAHVVLASLEDVAPSRVRRPGARLRSAAPAASPR